MPWGACEHLESVSRPVQETVTPFPVVGKQMNVSKEETAEAASGTLS